MPIFVERFLLPLFAGAVILLALSNPMGFDKAQRVAGSIATIALAYFCAHTIYKRTHPLSRATKEAPKALPDLKLEIDRVLPLWNYKPFQAPPGVPVPIPQGHAPDSQDADTYIAVIGKIINPRDVEASAEYWKVNAQLASGQTVEANLLAPPNQMVISHPNDPPEVISGQDYWPRKLDMRSIPAHGISYGFVFGVLKGVHPNDFDKPKTAVTLCFQDADGKCHCDTFTRKEE